MNETTLGWRGGPGLTHAAGVNVENLKKTAAEFACFCRCCAVFPPA